MITEEQSAVDQSEERFLSYFDCLLPAMTHPSHGDSMRAYCTGLCLDGERKSMEPIAAKLAPRHTESAHQALQHFVTDAPWSAEALLCEVRKYVLPYMTAQAPIQAWIIDDTTFPKQGKHSVGVAHQYCGNLGKQANCQVAVTLSVANEQVSLPIAYRLYLPKEWADDPLRRRKAGVPDTVAFSTKPAIALEQIRMARNEGVPCGVALVDAAYGNDTAFRDALSSMQVPYCVDVRSDTTVWAPGTFPLPPKKWNGRGRKPTNLRRTAGRRPKSVKHIATHLPKTAYQTVQWREGTAKTLSSRFAAVRVRAAHGETRVQRPEEWLLIEWPQAEKKPTRYALSTLPPETSLEELVRIKHLRWRIERDFEELKQELGLDHFEGRKWLGFHHHGALCIAAYGFIAAERSRFSPSSGLAVGQSAISDDCGRRGDPPNHRAA